MVVEFDLPWYTSLPTVQWTVLFFLYWYCSCPFCSVGYHSHSIRMGNHYYYFIFLISTVVGQKYYMVAWTHITHIGYWFMLS
jgi:hypothetical protein